MLMPTRKCRRGEEFGPLGIEQHAVGLQRVGDLASVRVATLQLDGATEEVQARSEGAGAGAPVRAWHHGAVSAQRTVGVRDSRTRS
jgi:hypothetical protein